MMYLYFFVILALYRGLITWKFYTAAGRKAWEAFVPFYNTWVLLQIIERPKWWIAIYYVPVVDNVMAIIVTYELLHMFKFRKVTYTIFAVLTLGLYLGYLNYSEPLKLAQRDDSWIKQNLGSTVNAILFAIVAATLIRSTTFESYTIPTGSMEESLLVGDFLFVSKMHYGVRLPITPFTIPLMHNVIIQPKQKTVIEDGLSTFRMTDPTKTYVDWVQLPYVRLPKLTEVQHNDPVVFNYPADQFHDPIDKKENYVKRCVGTPGDSLRIEHRVLYVNGIEETLPDRARRQHSYVVFLSDIPSQQQLDYFSLDLDFNKLSVSPDYSRWQPGQEQVEGAIKIHLRDDLVEEFRQSNFVSSVTPYEDFYENVENVDVHKEGYILQKHFPNDHQIVQELGSWLNFTFDNTPAFWVPSEGSTIELNPFNYRMYKHIIVRDEGHTLEYADGQFLLDGSPATEYTFAQDYFWMMGDNRHNSADSRAWGFVPETHIVGKPVFIWMSWDGNEDSFLDKVRTERVFTTVNGTGERIHYFWPVIGLILLYNGFTYMRKKKKKQAA